jgi:hypothetical protein
MNDRWNLISNKKNLEHKKTTNKPNKNEMITMEDENTPEQKIILEKLYERKKRKFGEMDGNVGSSNKILLTPFNLGQVLQMKNVDNASNFTQADNKASNTLKPPSLKIDNININLKVPKSESTKIFAMESIEKFMYMDERFIDADRNIGYGGVNPGII